MIDWSKYPVWAKTQGRLSAVELLELGAWLSDVLRAERERCIAACHAVMHDDKLDRSSFEMGVAAVKMAIEALGDDDG